MFSCTLFGVEIITAGADERNASSERSAAVEASPLTKQEALDEKIISFIGEDSFDRNRDYIHINFNNVDSFYIKERINVVKVVETLEENGLLHLFLKNRSSTR